MMTFGIRMLSKGFPEAFKALPEPYQNDDCLLFTFKEQKLTAMPREDQTFALGEWEAIYDPSLKSWEIV